MKAIVMKSKKYLMFRTHTLRDALWVMDHQDASVVNSSMERRDPALRNLIEGMQQRGLQHEVDGCPLHVFLIEDERDTDYYDQFNEVEACFDADWFDREKAKVRFMKGAAYHDVTSGWSSQFALKNQKRSIDYTPPFGASTPRFDQEMRLR